MPGVRQTSSGVVQTTAGVVDTVAIPENVDNQWPVDEGSGSTLTDNIGSNNSTISGATWQSDADAVGGAYLEYDGTDDWDDLDSHINYLYNGDFTLTAFVRIDADDQNLTIYSDESDFTTSNGFRFRVLNGDLGAINEGTENLTTTLSLTVGQWHFVSFRYDSQNNDVVQGLDGTYETESNPASFTSPDSPVSRFGARGDGEFEFDGGIDERTASAAYLSDTDLNTLQNRRSDV